MPTRSIFIANSGYTNATGVKISINHPITGIQTNSPIQANARTAPNTKRFQIGTRETVNGIVSGFILL